MPDRAGAGTVAADRAGIGCGCAAGRLSRYDWRRRRDGEKAPCKQRLILQFVEIAARHVAPCGLPPLNRAAGVVVEVAIHGPVEVTQRRQSLLNIAALDLIEL